jgi:UDP-glucose:(heptosyl)LPS alpha-1,3-glucosyltransferase
MKIALLFPGCHRQGGVERIVYECARFLSLNGHEVNVVASTWEKDLTTKISYTRVELLEIPGFLSGLSYYSRCSSILKKVDYDVLATHGCVCPTGGVHWVQSVHRAWLEQCARHRKPFSRKWLFQKSNPLHPILLKLEDRHFKQRRYTKLIATTARVKEDLNRFYNVPAEDVVIIPNGFAPQEFNPERRRMLRSPMRSKLGLRDDEVALLFAANELDRKGYATVLRSLQILDRRDIKVLVVGRPEIEDVMSLAQRAGVARSIIACGHSGNIAEFHAAADIFVLPTQYEAFCLAILEALGSGIPVITTSVPGARDAIVAGVNGFTINNPNDGEELAACISSLMDADRRLRFSEAAPATVNHYQWPVVLKMYEQLLLQNRMADRSGMRLIADSVGV